MAESVAKYQRYDEYKASGVEWFEEIPRGWSYTYVGIVSDVIDPQPDHRAPAISQDGEGFPYIGIRDVNKDGTLNFETARPVEESAVLKQEKSFTIEPHNIIFCKVGTLGIPRKIMPHGRCALSATLVLIKAKKVIDSQFLLYILDSNCITLQTNFLATGSTRAALGIQQIRKFKMPFPTMLEQEKIANFLDFETAQIDTLIDKQQTLIQLLKEKRQAVISHAVTKGLNPDAPMKDSGVEWLGEVPEHWEVKGIKRLSEIKRGASPRPIADQKYFDEEGEYAWTRIADVSRAGMYLDTTTQRLSDLGASLSVKLEAGELFLSIAGTVGKPCITISKACIHDGFVYFPTLKINNKFLFYIFEAGQAYLGLGKMGTQLNLNTETVGGIKIGLPPENEIDSIIAYIESEKARFDSLITKAEQVIQLMQERRTALISAAVTGKIDVRGWQAPIAPDNAKVEMASIT